ncbi:MAG: hypothetical protein AAF629_02190 [Chloroflexota bacterium]
MAIQPNDQSDNGDQGSTRLQEIVPEWLQSLLHKYEENQGPIVGLSNTFVPAGSDLTDLHDDGDADISDVLGDIATEPPQLQTGKLASSVDWGAAPPTEPAPTTAMNDLLESFGEPEQGDSEESDQSVEDFDFDNIASEAEVSPAPSFDEVDLFSEADKAVDQSQESEANGEPVNTWNSQEIPDWLNEIDTNVSTSDQPDAPAKSTQHLNLDPKDDVTDQIADEAPDWLNEFTAESQPSTPNEASVPAPETEEGQADVPDWLSEFTASHQEALSGTDSPQSTAEADPSSEVPPASQEPSVGDVEVPDWLAELDQDQGGEVPDSELKTFDLRNTFRQVDEETPVAPPSEPDTVSAPQDAGDDWLSELSAETTLPAPSSTVEETADDWLNTLSSETSEASDPSVTEDVEAEDWLNQLEETTASDAPPIATSETSSDVVEPDWLSSLTEDSETEATPIDVAVTPQVTPDASAISEPDNIDDDDDWLQEIAQLYPSDPAVIQKSSDTATTAETDNPIPADANQLLAETDVDDWLSQLDPTDTPTEVESPAARTGVTAWLSQLDTDAEPGIDLTGETSLPDLEKDTGQPDLGTLGSALDSEEVDNDWLTSLQPDEVGNVTASSDVVPSEALDWMQDVQAEDDIGVPSIPQTSQTDMPDQSTSTDESDDIPDWLANLEPESVSPDNPTEEINLTETAQETSGEFIEDTADWLANLDASEDTTTPLDLPEDPVSEDAPGLPAWLAGVTDELEPDDVGDDGSEGIVDESEALDWLSDIETQAEPLVNTPSAEEDDVPTAIPDFSEFAAEITQPTDEDEDTPLFPGADTVSISPPVSEPLSEDTLEELAVESSVSDVDDLDNVDPNTSDLEWITELEAATVTNGDDLSFDAPFEDIETDDTTDDVFSFVEDRRMGTGLLSDIFGVREQENDADVEQEQVDIPELTSGVSAEAPNEISIPEFPDELLPDFDTDSNDDSVSPERLSLDSLPDITLDDDIETTMPEPEEPKSTETPDWLSAIESVDQTVTQIGLPDWLAQMSGDSTETEESDLIQFQMLGQSEPATADYVQGSEADTDNANNDDVNIEASSLTESSLSMSSEIVDDSMADVTPDSIEALLDDSEADGVIPIPSPTSTLESPEADIEVPDWMSNLADETPVASVDDSEPSVVTTETVSETDVPEWMVDLGEEDNTAGTILATPTSDTDTELATPEPDEEAGWLESLRSEIPESADDNIDNIEVAPDVPDWMSGLPGDASADLTPETQVAETDDWLNELGSSEGEVTNTDEEEIVPAVPSWMSNLPDELDNEDVVVSAEEVPPTPEDSWLDNLQPETDVSSLEAIPDLNLPEIDSDVSSSDLPDWMQTLDTEKQLEDVQAEDGDVQLEADDTKLEADAPFALPETPTLSPDTNVSIDEPQSSVDETEDVDDDTSTDVEMPDWMANLDREAEPGSIGEIAEVNTAITDEAENSVPDWINDLDTETSESVADTFAHIETDSPDSAIEDMNEASLLEEDTALEVEAIDARLESLSVVEPEIDVEEAEAEFVPPVETPVEDMDLSWMSDLLSDAGTADISSPDQSLGEVSDFVGSIHDQFSEADDPDAPPELTATTDDISDAIADEFSQTVPDDEEGLPEWMLKLEADLTDEGVAQATPIDALSSEEEAPLSLEAEAENTAATDSLSDWLAELGASTTDDHVASEEDGPNIESQEEENVALDWLNALDAPATAEVEIESVESAPETQSINLPEADTIEPTSDVESTDDDDDDDDDETTPPSSGGDQPDDEGSGPSPFAGLFSGNTGILRERLKQDDPKTDDDEEGTPTSNDQVMNLDVADPLSASARRFFDIATNVPETLALPEADNAPKSVLGRLLTAGLYLAFMIILALPLFYHFDRGGIPFPWLEASQDEQVNVRNQLQSVVSDKLPGSIALVSFDYTAAHDGEMAPLAIEVIKKLRGQGMRVIAVSLNPEGAMLAQQVLQTLSPDSYGIDILNLGYRPGDVIAVRQFGFDNPLQGLVDFETKQAYTTFADWPEITKIADIALIVAIGAQSDSFQWWAEQLPDTNTPPILAVASSAAEPYVLPYVETGHYDAVIAGINGAAALESARVQTQLGPATQMLDSQSLAHLLIMILMLSGTMAGWFTKYGQVAA